jgi:hypothetical protein
MAKVTRGEVEKPNCPKFGFKTPTAIVAFYLKWQKASRGEIKKLNYLFNRLHKIASQTNTPLLIHKFRFLHLSHKA